MLSSKKINFEKTEFAPVAYYVTYCIGSNGKFRESPVIVDIMGSKQAHKAVSVGNQTDGK